MMRQNARIYVVIIYLLVCLPYVAKISLLCIKKELTKNSSDRYQSKQGKIKIQIQIKINIPLLSYERIDEKLVGQIKAWKSRDLRDQSHELANQPDVSQSTFTFWVT